MFVSSILLVKNKIDKYVKQKIFSSVIEFERWCQKSRLIFNSDLKKSSDTKIEHVGWKEFHGALRIFQL